MITTLRFTPVWLTAWLFVLGGCGDKTPKQAIARETASPESTVTSTPVQPDPTPVQPVTYDGADSAYRANRYIDAESGFTGYTRTKPSNPLGFYRLGLSAWNPAHLKKT